MEKLVKEELNERLDPGEGIVDIPEIVDKIDKWLPKDSDIEEAFWEIVDDRDVAELIDFLNTHANDLLDSYLGTQNIEDVATYIIETMENEG